MEEEHQDLDKPINKATRFTSYYSLRESPKKKCFTNHRALVHLSTKNNQKVYEESVSFSLVRKKKRSKLMRYKRTSFTFLDSSSVFAANDDELEVADGLLLLSKSSPKCLDVLKLAAEAVDVNAEPLKSCCLRNKKLSKGDEFEEEFSSHGALKDSASFLGGDNKLDHVKPLRVYYRKKVIKMVTESDPKKVEHQCRLCNKIFSSYQALGGHQTFHRVNNKRKNKKDFTEESAV